MKTRVKTAFCTLHPLKPSPNLHVGAVIINLEDKKEDPFVIEVWDPWYGRGLRDRKITKSLDFIKAGLRDKDLSSADTWKGLSTKEMEVVTLFSETSFGTFRTNYLKKFGDPKKDGDFWDENFDSCCYEIVPAFGLYNNCSTPVDYAKSQLIPTECSFEGVFCFGRLVVSPFYLLGSIFCSGSVDNCLPSPPCTDRPRTVLTSVRFYAQKHGIGLLFSDSTSKTPLLSETHDHKGPSLGPVRQAMA